MFCGCCFKGVWVLFVVCCFDALSCEFGDGVVVCFMIGVLGVVSL